jgi:hypothetical protein
MRLDGSLIAVINIALMGSASYDSRISHLAHCTKKSKRQIIQTV